MGGGGTDLSSYYSRFGGFLLSATINKYVFILINKRFYETIRLSYSTTEIVESVEQIQHPIFREALKFTKVDKNIEIVSVADVPSNCGLGTSSTFLVALLNGLFAFKKEYISLSQLAEAACEIEIGELKQPIGKQDQYSAAFGGFNAYWFDTDGMVTVEPVKIRDEDLIELQNNLFLFHLKKERSAASILAVQDQKCKEGERDVIERLHKIKELGIHTKNILEMGKVDEFGEILHEHWLIKKGLSDEISEPFIDEVYETARKNGVIGGKIVGAGGGGFFLFYCPRHRHKLVEEMKKLGLTPLWFTFENEGAKIIYYG